MTVLELGELAPGVGEVVRQLGHRLVDVLQLRVLELQQAQAGIGRRGWWCLALGGGERQVITDSLVLPEGLAVRDDGRLFVAEAGAGRVSMIDAASGQRWTIAEGLAFGTVVSRAPAPVYLPSGVAVGPDGSIYVTEDRTNSIRRLTAARL